MKAQFYEGALRKRELEGVTQERRISGFVDRREGQDVPWQTKQ